MDRENAVLFEEFDEAPRGHTAPDLLRRLAVRPAQTRDVDALGRISAEREGGDAHEHGSAFQQALGDSEVGRSMIILVAELDGDVVGFGRARYLKEERGGGVGTSPEGWYLTGVVVDPRFRRLGIGARLTAERLSWIAERSDLAYYFSNARNRVSMALHRRFGFTELARGAEFAGVSFVGGEGVLFQADLSPSARRTP